MEEDVWCRILEHGGWSGTVGWQEAVEEGVWCRTLEHGGWSGQCLWYMVVPIAVTLSCC